MDFQFALGGRERQRVRARVRIARSPLVRLLSAVAASGGRKLLIAKEWKMVSQNFASWNQLEAWLRQVDRVRRAA